METKQDFCVNCSAKNEQDHEDMWAESMADYAIMMRAKEFGYADVFDRMLTAWRTHVLPTCNPFSLD